MALIQACLKSSLYTYWNHQHPLPVYPQTMLAAHLPCTRCTLREGSRGRFEGILPIFSMLTSASCVRPQQSQNEGKSVLLPQDLQHTSTHMDSQHLVLFLFLFLMRVDRPALLLGFAPGIKNM